VDECERAAERNDAMRIEFVRAVLDHLNDVVIVLNRDGTLRYASDSALWTLGHDPTELHGLDVIELVHPDDREDAVGALARSSSAQPGPLPRKVLRIRHGDGTWHWIEMSSFSLVDDPTIEGFVVTVRDVSERQAGEARLRALLANSSDIISIMDSHGVVQWSSAARTRVLGFPSGETSSHPDALSLIHPDDREAVQGAFIAVLDGARGPDEPVFARVQTADGEWRQLEMTATNLLDDPDVRGVIVNSRDVTARIAAEEALRQSEQRFRLLVQHAHDAVLTVDATGTCTYASPAITGALGYDPDDLIGERLRRLVNPDDLETLSGAVFQVLAAPSRTTTVEFRTQHADGSWRLVETSFTNLFDEPAVRAVVLNLHDVTELRAAQRLLEHQATHDSLTELPNRKHLHALGGNALQRSRARGTPMGVLYLDLDGFKPINDDIGHREGDLVLAIVARRLRDEARAEDVVGRLGGDEFCILCEDVAAADVVDVAERVRKAIREPIELGARNVVLDCSIGAAVATRGEVTLERLMIEADSAMRRAKLAGKGRVEFAALLS
jgi:diguanylate cyclase (GGDEF)-like protein/PAS domain S-box-containing protein